VEVHSTSLSGVRSRLGHICEDSLSEIAEEKNWDPLFI
jgi:hypothetical protein